MLHTHTHNKQVNWDEQNCSHGCIETWSLSNLLLYHQIVTAHEWASFSPPWLGGKALEDPETQHQKRRVGGKAQMKRRPFSETVSGIYSLKVQTYKILVVVICKEALETAGPVSATLQQTERTLLTAHIAVPRVFFDGRMSCSLTDEQVHTLDAETPENEPRLRDWSQCDEYMWYPAGATAYAFSATTVSERARKQPSRHSVCFSHCGLEWSWHCLRHD